MTTTILIPIATRKELKLFAVQNDMSMGKAVQKLIDNEKGRRRID